MISFNHLGNLGRLGNQMFQYASLKGIAIKNNLEYIIPPKDIFGQYDINVKKSDVNIFDCFNLKCKTGISKNPRKVESTFGFDKNLFNMCPDNIDLVGYFQTEKYFIHIEKKIKKEFTFKIDLLNLCKSFIKDDTISLHIRRGDYLTNPNHPPQPMSYYKKALSILPNLPVIVFSDDYEWCKKQELFDSDRFIIAEGNSTDCDLCLMTLCTHHIIANSSYSWWGAWLADSKQVIAPKKWFDGECVNKDTKDLYSNGWKVL